MTRYTHTILMALVALTAVFTSCDDDETYAEQRETERKQIQAFIKKGCTVLTSDGDTLLKVDPITVLSEAEFAAQDSTTNVANNEYVLFKNNGVYMQIVRQGDGAKLAEGESETIINRFYEYNIAGDSIQAQNRLSGYEHLPDKMTVSNTSGSLAATFISGIMKSRYSTTSVPEAWLYPLYYVNIGRQDDPDSEIAKVRLIVPSTVGQTDASTNVYPCFYEITYQKGR